MQTINLKIQKQMKPSLKYCAKKLISIFLAQFYGDYGIGSKIQRPRTMLTNRKHIFLGKNVCIRPYARIEPIVIWHGQKFNPKIEIEDNVTIEQNLHLTCANFVKIGSFSSITGYVCITDIDHEYRDISQPLLSQPLIVQETEIGKYCFIGTGVKIMAGVHIGEHSVIGANAVVTHDVPPFSVATGIPARVIKKFNFETNQWEKVE